jgi:hypothetical protein
LRKLRAAEVTAVARAAIALGRKSSRAPATTFNCGGAIRGALGADVLFVLVLTADGASIAGSG